MAMHNPLNDQHCECLDRVLQQTPAYIELAQACENCGWEFGQQFRERLQQQYQQAEAIKRTFFPRKP